MRIAPIAIVAAFAVACSSGSGIAHAKGTTGDQAHAIHHFTLACACTPSGCGVGACGWVDDGCGGTVNCGNCPTGGGSCGGGGVPNVCGTGKVCVPSTCAEQGLDCGEAADGCGGILACGTCPSGQTCGGACVPNHCG